MQTKVSSAVVYGIYAVCVPPCRFRPLPRPAPSCRFFGLAFPCPAPPHEKKLLHPSLIHMQDHYDHDSHHGLHPRRIDK